MADTATAKLRLLGFEFGELLNLRMALAERDITLAQAIEELGRNDAKRAWRRHYGLMADLAEPTTDPAWFSAEANTGGKVTLG